MSRTGDDPNAVTKVLRTVTPGSRPHRDVSMDTFGWVLFLGMIVILVPLIPFLVLTWVLLKIGRFVRRDVLGD